MFRDHEYDCASSGHVVYLYRLYLQTVKSWSCLFYVHQALLSHFYILPGPFIFIYYTPSGLIFMVTHEQVILFIITHYQFLFCLYRSSGPVGYFINNKILLPMLTKHQSLLVTYVFNLSGYVVSLHIITSYCLFYTSSGTVLFVLQLAVVHIIRSCKCLRNKFPFSMFTDDRSFCPIVYFYNQLLWGGERVFFLTLSYINHASILPIQKPKSYLTTTC
jgi:hypothetical protein